MINFSFRFDNKKQKEQMNEAAKEIAKAVESYQNAIQASATQYNEHRRNAEEQISRGAKLTKHRINL